MLRLKELREKLNISQKTIAEYLGVNRTTYTKYETEKSEPDIQTLIKLSNYFGVTVDYLIGNEDVPASTTVTAASGWDLDEREQTLLTTFRSTTEEGRQLIIQSVLNIRDEIVKKSSYSAQSKAAE